VTSTTFKMLSCLLTAAVGLFAAASANAQICRVTEAGTSSGDGSHWDDEPMDLDTALGDPRCAEIWLKAGVYTSNGSGGAACFLIAREVQVYGGFAGNETSRSQRDPAAHPTVLSGDIGNDDIVDDRGVTLHWSDLRGANRCVLIIEGDSSGSSPTPITTATVLDGLIITAGIGGSGYNGASGGGFVCSATVAGSECSPTLDNVSFYGNSVGSYGGAMFNYTREGGVSRPVLHRTTFIGNRAGLHGGAMYNLAWSGGVTSPVLFDATFHDNEAEAAGGAVFNEAARGPGVPQVSPEYYRVTFSANRAMANPNLFSRTGGGAMFNWSDGGPVRPRLENVTFTGNSAGPGLVQFGDGGAIKNLSGSSEEFVVTLKHVTFAGNSASADGGAIASRGVFNSGQEMVILDNVIAWGNTANPVAGPGFPDVEIHNNSVSSVVRDSIVKDGCPALSSVCSNVIDADPLLAPLADNGGPTRTQLPAANSPAIDAGNSTSCASADQRGVSRTQGGACDIGAVERIQAVELSVAVAGQGEVDAEPTPAPFIDGIVACDEAGAGQAHCRATYDEESKDNITLNLAPAPGWRVDSAEGCDGELADSSVGIAALLVDCTLDIAFAINQYTVTPLVTAGMGSISPPVAQAVDHGNTQGFTLMPDTGWYLDSVAGSCGGSLKGNTFTTGPITADCTVEVAFAINQYTVTPLVTFGMGSLSPDTPQSVEHGSSLDIVLAPAPGWDIGSVSGCGGSLSGNTWSTGPITGDCEVSVSFVALLPAIFDDGFE